MKTIPLVCAAVMAIGTTVRSQDVTAAVPVAGAVSPGSAHLLDNLNDGTPPPPSRPKPEFVVPRKDVLATTTHQQGGRTITIQEIKPIALPPPPQLAPPLDLNDPIVKARIARFRAARPHMAFILVGATVYHSKDAPTRTLVRAWPQAQGVPVTVWSSADFALLSGFSTFVGSSGETASLMMMWSVMYLDNLNKLQERFGRKIERPKIPDLPPGPATFVVAGGTPTPQTLASIQTLHDLYNNEFSRLLAASEGRQRASLLREAELKAHPPQPKDIVLSYWRIDTPGQAGAVQGGGK